MEETRGVTSFAGFFLSRQPRGVSAHLMTEPVAPAAAMVEMKMVLVQGIVVRPEDGRKNLAGRFMGIAQERQPLRSAAVRADRLNGACHFGRWAPSQRTQILSLRI